jgi:hypothetical protein
MERKLSGRHAQTCHSLLEFCQFAALEGDEVGMGFVLGPSLRSFCLCTLIRVIPQTH